MIPMIDLASEYRLRKSRYRAALDKVLESGVFIGGDVIRSLEKRLASYVGSRYCITCGNGTDALYLAIRSLNPKPGAEVILPAFGYVAVVEVITLLGLTPIFADIDPRTFNIDTTTIPGLVTSRTAGIIPIHLFGQPADMKALLETANNFGLWVVEDNAQSFGAAQELGDNTWLKAGAIGKIGCTSFFPTKILGCYGDGGAMFTDDEQLAEELRMLANHGQKERYTHCRVGVNSRLDALQAAILSVKLDSIDVDIARRQAIAAEYDHAFLPLMQLTSPYRSLNSTHVYHQYTVRLRGDQRSTVRQCLTSGGVASMIYYPRPLYAQPAYRKFFQDTPMPNTEAACSEVLSLPISGTMPDHQTTAVIELVTKSCQL